MKLLSSVLLFIGSTAALSLEGVYRFRSESKGTKGLGNFVTADVYVSRVAGRNEGYSLQVKNLKLEDNLIDFSSSPFEFRVHDGQVVEVLSDPYEHYITKNLKKAIVESLQTSEKSDNLHEVIEFGGNGIKKVEYVSASENNNKFIQATYNRDSFVEFPKNSRLEESDFVVSAKKNTHVANDRILQVESKVELNFFSEFQKTEVRSLTNVDFVKSLDTVVEASDKVTRDTLVHEVDLDQRISHLRSTIGNPVEYMNKFMSEGVSREDFLKKEAKLFSLLSIDPISADEVVEEMSKKFTAGFRDSRLFFILSRIDTIESHKLLAERLLESLSEKDSSITYTILRAIGQLNKISEESPLLSVLQTAQFPDEVRDMAELTLGSISKHLPEETARQILASFAAELETTKCPIRKTQLIHILGNAKTNSPSRLIGSFLEDSHQPVRSAAMLGLRGSLHLPEVQKQVTKAFPKSPEKETFVNLLKSMKGNAQLKRSTELDALLQKIQLEHPKIVQEVPESLRKFMEDRIGSTSKIWNDSSDPLYNYAAPLSQRQQDVDRYPSYEGFLNAELYGPRLANLKYVTGVFSGQSYGDGCLAGNFKIFDHLYTETSLLGNSHLLADLELYIYAYNDVFDSRIYGNIRDNIVIEFKITSNCTNGVIPIFDGEVFLIDYSSEFPIDIGSILVTAQAIVGLEFEAGYKLCLLVINPYVELYLTGRVELVVDLEVLVTIVGLFRGGISAEVFLNYEIGPETQIGTRNSSGSLTCEACIGVYYGYEAQDVSLSLWFQRREGLSWGEPTVIPIYEWNDPAVPFPTPLVEECGNI